MAERERVVQDRRIERTRGQLHQALASLIREKSYDDISVKEILGRANVGRSTFYMHFRDKDALLASAARDMLRPIRRSHVTPPTNRYEAIIAFSLPVFEHIHQHRGVESDSMGTRGRAVLHEHLRLVLVDWIADSVSNHLHGRRKPTAQMSPDLLARYLASTFTLVLNWWLESHPRLSPREGDDMFRTLVLPTLAAAWG